MMPRDHTFLSIAFCFLTIVLWSGVMPGDAAAQNSVNRMPNETWTTRVITQRELEHLSDKDMEISPSVALRLLAKLNARDFDYIAKDIQEGKPLKVPNDFSAFKNWTPIVKYIPDVVDLPKFILIVKDLPHIGWYERGRLVGDTYICVGRVEGSTREGLYTVLQKDLNHVSRSYPNAWGGACSNALGTENIRNRLDSRRRHSGWALLPRLHQFAHIPGGGSV